MHKNPPNNKKENARHSTFIGTIFSTLFNLILIALLSWLLLTIWLSLKTYFSTDYLVSEHVREILYYDMNLLINKKVLLTLIPIFQNIQETVHIILCYALDPLLSEKLTTILVGSIEIILIRSYLFSLSIPFFLVIYSISIVDGLVQRDIRKFKGARESTFFFHRVKPLSNISLLTLFFIYMVIPLAIPPEFILVPMVMISGFFVMLSIKSYKKYL